MKRNLLVTLLIFLISIPAATLQARGADDLPEPPAETDAAAPNRKKVGVILSGGGAKGVVHVGALKVLEEAGIPIDYISGTSMGAIIGGLYAAGYDTQTLDSLLRAQNWPELFSDRVSRRNLSLAEREISDRYILTLSLSADRRLRMPSGLLSGTKVLNLLTSLTLDYKDSMSFSELPIPFACVAYDLASGQSVTLDHGNLAESVRASMSIPGAFEPVRRDSMVLIDGGISNNFPVNVVRDMGAEILIGIDVAAGDKDSKEINTLMDMFDQITWYAGLEAYEQNKKMLDLYIHPDIEGYNAASFSPAAIDTLLVRGEQAGRAHWDEIVALREKIGLPEGYRPPEREKLEMERSLNIGEIRFVGNNSFDDKTLLRVSGLKENTVTHPSEIEAAISRLQGVGGLKDVMFRLEGNNPHNLVISLRETTRSYLGLGVRFDTEEMAAILLNASMGFTRLPHTRLEITGRLSESPYGQVSLLTGNETARKFSISYRFKYNKLDIYEMGSKISNMDFTHQTLDLNYSSLILHHFRATLGLRGDYYNYETMLTTSDFNLDRSSERQISYYASVRYESFDDRYLPRRGLSFGVDYALHTSDFYSNYGHRPYSSLDADVLGAISISKRVCFLPGAFARVIIGKNIPYPSLNMMGGTVDGRYMPQQIRFVGIRRFELFDHSVAGVRLDMRIRLWRKHHLSIKSNYAKEANDFWDILDGNDIWGVGLAWNYKTVIGPIDLQVDYSNRTKKVGVYANIGYYF